MYRVKIIGKLRGFFRHLVELEDDEIQFVTVVNNPTFEVNSKSRTIISNLLKTRFVGFWGLFKTNKVSGGYEQIDCYMSFNRFCKSDKPYIIYLENPTALCNYSLTCLSSPFVKRRLKKALEDNNLKKIICMSKACESTLEKVLGVKVDKKKIAQIYPYVPANEIVSPELIWDRCKKEKLKLLYIAQGGRFYSKGALEVIEAVLKLQKAFDVSLTMITNIDSIDQSLVEKLKKIDGITLLNFGFSYDEMEKIYVEHAVLLQPSSDDSFGLTVLEAMKAGLPVIASNMYAFKEMVEDGVNGYLVPPAYYFFDEDNLPNPDVWNDRKETIYSCKVNPELVKGLFEKIKNLCIDRDLLCNMSMQSLEKANTTFAKNKIMYDWETVISDIK